MPTPPQPTDPRPSSAAQDEEKREAHPLIQTAGLGEHEVTLSASAEEKTRKAAEQLSKSYFDALLKQQVISASERYIIRIRLDELLDAEREFKIERARREASTRIMVAALSAMGLAMLLAYATSHLESSASLILSLVGAGFGFGLTRRTLARAESNTGSK